MMFIPHVYELLSRWDVTFRDQLMKSLYAEGKCTADADTHTMQCDTQCLLASWRPAVVIFNPLDYVSQQQYNPTRSYHREKEPRNYSCYLRTHTGRSGYAQTHTDWHWVKQRRLFTLFSEGNNNNSAVMFKYECGKTMFILNWLKLKVFTTSYSSVTYGTKYNVLYLIEDINSI